MTADAGGRMAAILRHYGAEDVPEGHGDRRRRYPAGIVELVRYLYVTKGMTQKEVQAAIPPGYKVQRIIERHGIPVRSPAERRSPYR